MYCMIPAIEIRLVTCDHLSGAPVLPLVYNTTSRTGLEKHTEGVRYFALGGGGVRVVSEIIAAIGDSAWGVGESLVLTGSR